MQPPQKSMHAFIRTRTASFWRLIILSKWFREVHEDILQRRHLIRAMELRRQSGIHVIVLKLNVAPLRLALHLARRPRRDHLLGAARVRRQQPRHRIRRLEVHTVHHRRLRVGRRNRRLLVRQFGTLNFDRWLLLNWAFLVVYATQHPVIQLQNHNQVHTFSSIYLLIFNIPNFIEIRTNHFRN